MSEKFISDKDVWGECITAEMIFEVIKVDFSHEIDLKITEIIGYFMILFYLAQFYPQLTTFEKN